MAPTLEMKSPSPNGELSGNLETWETLKPYSSLIPASAEKSGGANS